MDFKGRARTYDKPESIKRSKEVADKIKELVGKQKESSAMEYGCATGLIGFNLCDEFSKLTLMDSDKDMIEVVKEKIKKYQTTNVIPINIDLLTDDYTGEKFDIIYTSMTLHHIIDTESIIKKLYNLINKNGFLCIFELDKEDGSFHMKSKDFNGYNGFEHEYLENALKISGFSNIKSETFYYSQIKYDEKIVPYSLFYTIGKKEN